MKKLIFFIVAVFFLGANCFAQNEGKFKSAKDNIDKSDVALQNPKKNTNPSTWMDRGKIFQDAYNINIGFLRFGMPTTEAVLFFKNPKQIVPSEEDGVEIETYEYSQIKLHFANGQLKSWEEIKTVVDNPLGEAMKAYQQAAVLDEKGKNAKKISEAYKTINKDLENKFFNEYANSQYVAAFNTALQRIELSDLIGVTDTIYYFYAGFAAYMQSETDSVMSQTAIEYFEKALAKGYKESGDSGGQIYDLLYNACIKNNDPEKALRYAQTGFERYPNNDRIMYDLINYYLARGENHKTLEYIEQAVAKDPQNANLLFAQGRVLDELGETDKSLAAYDAAIALDPSFFDPIFNKAVVYYNHAVKIMDEANDAKTNDEFDRLKNLADDEFAKAIPLLEKALELKPNETATMDTLKTLYYRLRTRFPEFEAKYDDMVQRLEKQ